MSITRIGYRTYDGTDYVGFGTTSPNHALHIYSTAATDNQYEYSGILLQNATSNEVGIAFKNAVLGNDVWVMGLSSNSSRFSLGYGPPANQISDTDALVTVTSGGSLGIGTTAPRAKMHIVHPGSGDILRIDDQTSPFIINEAGNVGIGTTLPQAPLHIQGTALLTGALRLQNTSASISMNSSDVRYFNTNAGRGHIFLVWNSTGARTAFSVQSLNTSDSITRVSKGVFEVSNSSDATSLFVNLQGNVGIGTSSVDAKLVVQGGDIALGNTANGGYKLYLTEDRSNKYLWANNNWVELQSHANEGVRFVASSTETMRIVGSSGNVGIGTTNPLRKLHIEGDVNFTGSLYQNNTAYISSQWTTHGTSLHYNTGNVGIGVTNPSTKLHVVGNALVTDTLTTSNLQVLGETTTIQTFVSQTSNVRIRNELGTGPALVVAQKTVSGSGTIVDFFDLDVSESVPAFRVGDQGMVGINTTSAGARLSVGGSVGIGSTYTGIAPPTDGLIIAGSVGIGTTSPTTALHVEGSFRATTLAGNGASLSNLNASFITSGTLLNGLLPSTISVTTLTGNHTGTADSLSNINASLIASGTLANALLPSAISVTSLAGNGASLSNLNASLISDGTLDKQRLPPALSIATDTQTITVTSTGNVGIGTTNPAYTLAVDGSIHFTNGLYDNGVPHISSQWTTSAANIHYVSGNVGIGSDTPSAILDVVGDAKISGRLSASNLVLESAPIFDQYQAPFATQLQPNPARGFFEAAHAGDSNFTLTLPGVYTASGSNAQIYYNGTKLGYLSPMARDFEVQTSSLSNMTTFDVTIFVDGLTQGDTVDVIIWPSYVDAETTQSGYVFQYLSDGWRKTSQGIYPTDNVGFGTTTPQYVLHAVGTSGFQGNVVPTLSNVFDLGSAALRWRDLYLSGNTIDLGGTLLSRDPDSGSLAVKSLDGAPLDTTARNIVASGTIEGSNVRVQGNVGSIALNVSGDAFVRGTLTASNMQVLGDTTILQTFTQSTSNVRVTNTTGTGPALAVSQSGNGFGYSIAEFFDADVSTTVPAFKIADGGNVGVGTTLPIRSFHVQGFTYLSSNLEVNGEITTTGDITGFGTVSDARLKNKVASLETMDILPRIQSLRPVSFEWSEEVPAESKRGQFDMGLIAQEVHEIFPHVTRVLKFPGHSVEYQGIQYDRFVPILVKGMQDILQRLERIESRLSEE
jgi:hypothetical protein